MTRASAARSGFVMAISRTELTRASLMALLALQCLHCAGVPSEARSADAASLEVSGADGSRLALFRTWQDHRATVLVFWSSQCPCVRRYQARIDDLAQRFPTVRVLGISSNAGETLEGELETARSRGIGIGLWRDEGGAVAEAMGARSTPTVVLVDDRGRIRYRGWIDNERLPGDADREPWLENAIRGVLEGHDDFATRSPVYGCTITRSLFAKSKSTCCKE